MNIFEQVPVIDKLINKRRKLRLRLMNQGYEALKKTNQLDLIMQLQDSLTKTKLNNARLSKNLLESGFNIELSVRQFLKVRFLSLKFNEAILYSIGSGKSLKYPLPKEWHQILIGGGIRVSSIFCTFLWRWRVFIFWGYGALQGIKSIYCLFSMQPTLGKHIYFDGLAKNNFSNNVEAHNVINWYLQWKGKAKNINAITHSVVNVQNYPYQGLQIIYTDGLPKIKGVKAVKYILWSVYLTLKSFIFIFSKPYSALLLGEVLKLIKVKITDNNQLASDYLFHNSGPFYRPLWTYEAEKKGARVLFYFYSTNNENFKTEKGYPIQNPWHLISWQHYLVWDKYQSDFVRRFNDNARIEEVGPIWLSSHDIELPAISGKSVAVFDVAPVNEDFYITLGIPYEFYIPENANQFLNDIQSVLANDNCVMAHKMKRINLLTHQRYTDNIERLKEKSNYLTINPSLDATKLIQKTGACISMPFTSTAIIAKQNGKPSVYYDPNGMIQKDDRAAHGIPVLSGIEELREWVQNLNG